MEESMATGTRRSSIQTHHVGLLSGRFSAKMEGPTVDLLVDLPRSSRGCHACYRLRT